MNLTNGFRAELDHIPYLNAALDFLIARINLVFTTEHSADGAHTDVTATSVTTTEDITVGGDVEVEGDVIALDGSGTECGLGTLSTINGTSLLPAEVSRQGLLLGGVSTGCFIEWRGATTPFVSGREVAIWNLGFSTTRPLFRVGVFGGVPTLLDGGSGVSLTLGDITDRIAAVHTSSVTNNGPTVDSGVISPPQLTANQNNYNPTGLSTARVLRLSSDASRTITGLTAQTAGTWLALINGGAQDIVLAHNDGVNSSAANVFICPGLVNYTLNAGDSVQVWYDGTSSLWRVIAAA